MAPLVELVARRSDLKVMTNWTALEAQLRPYSDSQATFAVGVVRRLAGASDSTVTSPFACFPEQLKTATPTTSPR